MFSITPLQHSRMGTDSHSVVIVGGGVSGLFAALKLVENGFQDVTVLEADSRFGGRVHSLPHKDGVLELGAQWIHGRGECPLWKFVNDNQIAVTADESGDGDGTFYLPGGEIMPQDILHECQEFSEGLHWHLNKFYESKPLDTEQLPHSVGHFFEEQIEAFLDREKDEDKLKLKRGFCDWFLKWELVDTGVSNLKNQSVKSWIEYIDYEMETKFDEGEPILDGGYSKLVEFLITSLTGHAKLNLNSKCTKVSWDNGSSDIRVTLENGDIYTAGCVVVALPLGVLKHSHESLFVPSLPKSKIEIIEKLDFGLMNKIFLEFEEIFWDEDNPGIQFIMTDYGCPEDSEDVALNWWRSIAGFDSVCGQPRVLCGWISGPPAAYMETLSDEAILDTCWSLLKRHVGLEVARPVTCTASRWGSNPNVRGSYSYSTPECDARHIGPRDMAAPVIDTRGNTKLLFCGEASDPEHYGTVTGAMLAGCREGVRLAEIIKQKN